MYIFFVQTEGLPELDLIRSRSHRVKTRSAEGMALVPEGAAPAMEEVTQHEEAARPPAAEDMERAPVAAGEVEVITLPSGGLTRTSGPVARRCPRRRTSTPARGATAC